MPLPVAPDVPEGLPIVPQLEAPKAPPVPEVPSSVSAPFAAAEEAKASASSPLAAAEAAKAANLPPAAGNPAGSWIGDIGQTMAENAAAAAADMVKSTNEAVDEANKAIDSAEGDSSSVNGTTGADGTIKVAKVDKLGHVVPEDETPNRVMTIGESDKLKERRARQKKWQRREAEREAADSRKRAKMKCRGPDGEPVYCSAKGAHAKMKCVGPDGEPAYCSEEGAKPAPA